MHVIKVKRNKLSRHQVAPIQWGKWFPLLVAVTITMALWVWALTSVGIGG